MNDYKEIEFGEVNIFESDAFCNDDSAQHLYGFSCARSGAAELAEE